MRRRAAPQTSKPTRKRIIRLLVVFFCILCERRAIEGVVFANAVGETPAAVAAIAVVVLRVLPAAAAF